MAETKVETVEIPQEQAQAIAAAVEEEEWESDWAAIFWAMFFLVIVLCGCGIAAWQPWII